MTPNDILALTKRPSIYTPGTATMWTDPYISKGLLETHLSQETDLASRKLTTVEKTIRWILSQVPGRSLSILDLGCGPGLYTERLAKKGHCVTGMDFSPRSIAHAQESAARARLDITYRCQDYLTLEDQGKYDLILMVFTDFGVLFPHDRHGLLKKIRRALTPGGIFIFDVLNTHWLSTISPERTWEALDKGFWRPHPHLVLSETFIYKADKVVLHQHMVTDPPQGTAVYRFYSRAFSKPEIRGILAEAGLRAVGFCDCLLPSSSLYRPEDVTFCLAQRP